MKRTALLITALVIILAGAYLWFDKYYTSEPTSLWTLVPANALAVYETSEGAEKWAGIKATPLWTSLTGIRQVQEFTDTMQQIDTLDGISDGLSQLLSSQFLISTHLVGKNSFDQLYLVDMASYESQYMVNSLLENYQLDSTVARHTRVYQDMEISELAKGETIFSYLVYDNKLIASFTPFLVEDVIRKISDENVDGFFDIHPSLRAMPKLSQDQGNLYINMRHFGDFIKAFANPETDRILQETNYIGQSAFLDVSVKERSVLLNGFTDQGGNETLLSAFADQVPVESDFKFKVPASTAIFRQYTFSDAAAWHRRMSTYWAKHQAEFLKEREEYLSVLNMDINSFFATIGTSLSLIQLEKPGSTGFIPVVIADLKDNAGIRNLLNSLGESIARAEGDTTYVEQYGTYEIRELNISQFPMHVLGPDYEGFERTYFTFYNNSTLVLAPDLFTLKEYIDAVDSEDTWGRSVLYNRFLEGLLKESNLTMVVNTRRAWEHLLSRSDEGWGSFIRENDGILKSFGLFSIQFSKLNENFYTSLSIQQDGRPVQVVRAEQEPPKMKATLPSPAITKPFVVTNHIDNTREILVQDSSATIYLIGPAGDVLWSNPIGKKIRTPVSQVDYYVNGKLQYFFATDSAIHIIDRLGNYVEGFPKRLPFRVKYASVLDYDKSRNYRFLLSDDFGNLTMLNKEGEQLEGWSPRVAGGRLSSAPFHVRIRGRDCIVAVEAAGKIHIMNRRGEYYPGFPLEMESRVEFPVFFEPGANFEESRFTLVDKDGRLTSFNLLGKVIRSEQLYKPTTETEYELVPDVLGKTFVLARFDRRRMVLLDRDQTELMSKDYIHDYPPGLQYYDFGSDIRAYIVSDPEQGFTYLYGNGGQMIGSRPLNSGEPVGLMYSELTKEFTIYYVSGNEVLVRTY